MITEKYMDRMNSKLSNPQQNLSLFHPVFLTICIDFHESNSYTRFSSPNQDQFVDSSRTNTGGSDNGVWNFIITFRTLVFSRFFRKIDPKMGNTQTKNHKFMHKHIFLIFLCPNKKNIRNSSPRQNFFNFRFSVGNFVYIPFYQRKCCHVCSLSICNDSKLRQRPSRKQAETNRPNFFICPVPNM